MKDSDIERRYGSRAYKDGLSNYKEGLVTGPEILSDGIRKYSIDDCGGHIDFLVWTDSAGNLISIVSERRNIYSDYSTAVLIADSRYLSGSREAKIDPEALPNAISQHRLFDITYELEDWHGEDNKECYDEVVNGFFDSVMAGPDKPAMKLNILDAAVESCYSYKRFDASYASSIIIGRRNELSEMVSELKPSELSGILGRTDRRYSRSWIVGIPGLSGIQASVAFTDLSDNEVINEQDCIILSSLLELIPDLCDYAGCLSDDMTYYERERIVRREQSRGHNELAIRLADTISEAEDIDKHLTEAGRLRRDLGLSDDNMFIDSFIREPNGKRLIDVLASHPDADVDDLLDSAWMSCSKDPVTLIFFCRQGRDVAVAECVADSVVHPTDDEETDSFQLLAEVLCDSGHYDEAAMITMSLLSEVAKLKGFESDAAHMMHFLDDMYDGEPKGLEQFCRRFRCEHKRKALWDAYGEPKSGHF